MPDIISHCLKRFTVLGIAARPGWLQMPSQAGAGLARLWGDPAVRFSLLIFILLRVFLSVWMWVVRQIFSAPFPPDEFLRPYVGVTVETNPWLEPWQRWDAIHYQAIAERGYQAFGMALFVPPLYPLLIRGLASLLGGRTLLAGVLISSLAFLACLVALYRLVLHESGDRHAACRTVVYLASFPAAFFFLAAYTESLFLLAAVLALSCVRQEKWWKAGFWGAVAALVRLPGLLILVPLTYTAWQSGRRQKTGRRQKSWRPWAPVGITLAGGAIFPLYAWLGLHLLPWTPWQVQEARFQGGLAFPGANLIEAFRRIFSGQFAVSDLLDAVFLVVFLACLVPVWRRLPRVYAVYCLTFLGLYLVRMSGIQPLLGTARYVVVLFPAFMIFAFYGQHPWVNRLILYLSWIGLLFMAGQFAIWGWVG